MKLLVDTHTFLWLMESPEKLSKRASDDCSNPTNSLYLSAASLWEIQIKSQLGKLDLGVPLSDVVEAEVTKGPFEFLPNRADHVLAVGDLPPHHNVWALGAVCSVFSGVEPNSSQSVPQAGEEGQAKSRIEITVHLNTAHKAFDVGKSAELKPAESTQLLALCTWGSNIENINSSFVRASGNE